MTGYGMIYIVIDSYSSIESIGMALYIPALQLSAIDEQCVAITDLTIQEQI